MYQCTYKNLKWSKTTDPFLKKKKKKEVDKAIKNFFS